VTTSVTWQRFLGTVAALVFGLVLALARPTTTASASTYIYDGPTVARIGAHAIDNAGATPFEVSDVAEQSAWPVVTARGTSTTSSGSLFATEAASSSIDDLLQPGGSLIGKAGTDETIRELTGGLPDAQAMFQQLSQGGTVVEQTATMTRVQLADGGFVQLRTVMSRSPGTVATIDVNIPGLDITKLKFNP
jgi:hypothetical protein